jgi:hypothetical protein
MERSVFMSESTVDASASVTSEEVASEVPVSEEVSADGTEEGEEGVESEETKPSPELFSIKINGKIVQMTREQLIENASHGAAAQSKFQEAANLRKEVDSVFQALKTKPLQTLKALGIPLKDQFTFDELESLGIDVGAQVDKYVEAKLAELEKSPEQRNLEARQKEQEEKEKKIKELEAKLNEREEAEALARAEREITEEIISALKSTAELEPTPYVVKRMATAMQLGYSAEDAAKIVENEYMQEWNSRIAKLNEDQLMKIFGKDKMDDLRKKRLDKRKKVPEGIKTVKDTGGSGSSKEKVSNKVSITDFFDKLGE